MRPSPLPVLLKVTVFAAKAVLTILKKEAAAETGTDLGKAAVWVVEEAIESAQTVGVDATDAATAAVSGAIRAAEKIGGQTASIVREALLGAATLPRDVVERVLKGSEE
ncbi:MAG: hypothetical protein UX78_C0018G0017 [Candidatus Amesbacteria bacterium GW2011_GWA2_47_11]|uniref:Uncharacterized protein n=1 Tax=Candidatus Amesbacteria bacterium GW2011_GWA2_47_11 TaxID=1618357 RepID=A0A0G1REU1_9BACT|nr:MAG: hypothetical protein UX78_C0018G0017 [Candidatus Amesbacteria bacterium GW2011_GWA2_47_11]